MRDEVLEERKKSFKQLFMDAPPRRLEEYATNLRKKKRDHILREKRLQTFSEESGTERASEGLQKVDSRLISADLSLPEKLKIVSQVLCSPIHDLGVLVGLLKIIRRAVSVPSDLHVELVVKLDLIPKLSVFLDIDNADIRKEVVQIVANIAAGESSYVNMVLSTGAHYKLVGILSSSSAALKEQCLWALGNIAGDGVSARNELISTRLIEELLKVLTAKPLSLSLAKVASWAAANLCRDCPLPSLEQVALLIDPLGLMISSEDAEVVSNALWALSYLSDNKFAIKYIRKSVNVQRLADLLLASTLGIKVPAIRIAGCLAASDPTAVAALASAGGIQSLQELVRTCAYPEATREACRALSNIAAGPTSQIQLLIDCGAIKDLGSIAVSSPDFAIRKEAVWAVANACCLCDVRQVNKLVMEGAMEPLCLLLNSDDPELLLALLEGIHHVLEAEDRECAGSGSNNNKGALGYLASTGYVRKIESLLLHNNVEIYKKVAEILSIIGRDEGELATSDTAIIPPGNGERSDVHMDNDDGGCEAAMGVNL